MLLAPTIPLANLGHPLNRGLVGWWMRHPSVGGGHLMPDIGGRNIHGTLTNMDPGTDWVATPYGPALDFDNSNGRVSLSSLQLDFIGDITISALIYPRSLAGGNLDHVWGGYNTSSPYQGCALDVGTVIYFWDGSAWRSSSASAVTTSAWQVVTASVIGGTVYFYASGVPFGSSITTARTSYTGERAIGARAVDSSSPFDGCIAWVMLHSRGLSAAEVAMVAAEGRSGFPTLLSRPRRHFAKAAAGGGGGPVIPVFMNQYRQRAA